MKIRHRKHNLYKLFAQDIPYQRLTQEDRDWLDMPPIGYEFASPDYDRLTAIDDEIIAKQKVVLIQSITCTWEQLK